MKKQFCGICRKKQPFERFENPQETEIRGTKLSVIHEYDRCEVCHTTYEPSENRYKNILKEYATYREKVDYLQPEEIRTIREKYNLNIHQFASVLGMNYQDLARIEFGALQNAYQNNLFKLAASPKSMYEVIQKRREFIGFSLDTLLKSKRL